jgi:hypothetical protein
VYLQVMEAEVFHRANEPAHMLEYPLAADQAGRVTKRRGEWQLPDQVVGDQRFPALMIVNKSFEVQMQQLFGCHGGRSLKAKGRC